LKNKKIDIVSEIIPKRPRSDLMKECLKLGLPVRADDTYETLDMFLLIAKENEVFDAEYEDFETDYSKETPVKLKYLFKKVISKIYGIL